ncbi:YwaF family protein [Lutispora saccharofermentans]|uniref:TIGR02206 family membrane protein n=1 Tax=Lutispora saccharofermentans TaxID=3024236 RepID=A0ABT1NFF8_9FIRM|nr:TIGR02206 family membrane protein [Lutispora saccharofermentans]MCQ1528903.1 TIGR02206 family membrane protein [Lutispora saccharofermentans]
MGKWFNGEPFRLLSRVHIAALLIIFILNMMIYFFSDRLREVKTDKLCRNIIALALITTELSFQIWCAVIGVWTAEYNLPFHLCSAATIICAIMLFMKSYRIYQIAYFWGLGGALQALLTPDLSGYNYPHYVFFKYFILHGLIVISVLYMAFVHSYRLAFRSVLNAFAVTNLFAVIVIPVDILTGGNYLFLCRKPEAMTLLDYLGPWPWYIIPMEAVVFAMFVILYLPYAISDFVQKHRDINSGISPGA